jgi:hypothetical protein
MRITCDRCGKDRMLNEAHVKRSDMLIRDIFARMRHGGCGGRAGKVELLTGIGRLPPPLLKAPTSRVLSVGFKVRLRGAENRRHKLDHFIELKRLLDKAGIAINARAQVFLRHRTHNNAWNVALRFVSAHRPKQINGVEDWHHKIGNN